MKKNTSVEIHSVRIVYLLLVMLKNKVKKNQNRTKWKNARTKIKLKTDRTVQHETGMIKMKWNRRNQKYW